MRQWCSRSQDNQNYTNSELGNIQRCVCSHLARVTPYAAEELNVACRTKGADAAARLVHESFLVGAEPLRVKFRSEFRP